MRSITITNPGLLTTIQDMGRIAYQQYGVPAAGAMDQYSLQLANILVGNKRYEAVIEMTVMGATMKFNTDTLIAITGADMSPMINEQPIEMYRTIVVKEGDIVSFSSLKNGCRAYMAVAGGLDISEVMGSKSTYLRGEFGGVEGRKLKNGDIIFIQTSCNHKKMKTINIPQHLVPQYTNEYEARVILGPEQDYFTMEGIQTFLTSEYTLTNQYDRMGYRLDGQVIQHKHGADIISSGITFGAIQVPGHGLPIIMMADRQTTGGYTKIANVITVDLPYLAQLKPGDKVRFKEVSIEEAQQLIRQREQKLVKLEKANECLFDKLFGFMRCLLSK